MRCLVTGASGYIGRALVEGLLARGCEVTALYHQHPPKAPDPRVSYRALDLATAGDAHPHAGIEAASRLFHGVDLVFHLAGIAHQHAAPEAYARVNVEGSLLLAREALGAGVRRFVFFSSVKAADESALGQAAGAVADATDYATSKALAERRLRALCEGSEMQLVVVRPALVYGPDAPGHLAWLRRWVQARLPAPPPGGERSLIAREDLVSLCLCVLNARDLPAYLRVTATDGEAYSTRRLHAALCRAAGRAPALPSPGPGLWRAAAHAFDRLRGEAPGSTWQRLAGDEVHAGEGMEHLGFTPQLTFEKSLGVAP